MNRSTLLVDGDEQFVATRAPCRVQFSSEFLECIQIAVAIAHRQVAREERHAPGITSLQKRA